MSIDLSFFGKMSLGMTTFWRGEVVKGGGGAAPRRKKPACFYLQMRRTI